MRNHRFRLLIAFLGLLYVRVLLETLIVLFRIEDNTAALRRSGGPPPPQV